MSRFADVMQYLDQNRYQLDVSPEHAKLFETAVTKTFSEQGYPDDILSLDWSRFHSGGRPDKPERVEIRLALLATICRKTMSTTQARQYVNDKKGEFKNLTKSELNKKTGEMIRRLTTGLPICAEAVRYTLAHKGGKTYARGTCEKLGVTVEEYIDQNHPATLGVMVIDMQAADAGTKQIFLGRTVLDHEESVLKLAAKYKLHVFDIVIDEKHVNGGERSVFNHPNLRAAWQGAQVHGITKPNHPSFVRTELASELDKAGVTELVVMGYAAGQCVRATIFGVPENRQTVPESEHRTFVEAKKAWGAYIENNQGVTPYVPGLLEREYDVITSRAILASDGALDSQYEALAGL